MEIDIIENSIKILDKQLLNLLLADRSTNRNIVWATTDYLSLGASCAPEREITVEQIKETHSELIKPRVTKAKDKQSSRTRDKAEVCTPSWICNEQNNLIDEQWFGRPNVFNKSDNKKWKTNRSGIEIPANPGKTWKDYVRAKRMEITCGEAPYLASRYDTVSGEFIEDIHNRIGLLDRKLRVVDENTDNEKDWFMWTKKAYQSIYGYELQGDNLLLARENLLFSFADHMICKFGRQPTVSEFRQIAHIISWNIWQMDGLNYSAPYSDDILQEERFGSDEVQEAHAVPCVIRDWTKKCRVLFKDLLKNEDGQYKNNFDAVVGNPPYQIMDGGAQASAKPVYNFFVEQAEALQPKYVSMIIPARWYAGGKGLDCFRNRMLHNKHIITLHDFVDSNMCFANVDIKGGICYYLFSSEITGRCSIFRHEATGEAVRSSRYLAEENENIFIRYNELISIKDKVQKMQEASFESMVSTMKPYGLRGDFFKDTQKYALPPISQTSISGGYRIVGLDKLKRTFRYIPDDYPLPKKDMLLDYKVFITRNYGVGDLGEMLSEPIIAKPGDLCTETFIQIGPLRSETEAENIVSYIKTKFFRALVGLRKQDQGASKAVYRYVPIQDFSENSEINWNNDTDEIDRQLFDKYKLDQEEVEFINAKIK